MSVAARKRPATLETPECGPNAPSLGDVRFEERCDRHAKRITARLAGKRPFRCVECQQDWSAEAAYYSDAECRCCGGRLEEVAA